MVVRIVSIAFLSTILTPIEAVAQPKQAGYIKEQYAPRSEWSAVTVDVDGKSVTFRAQLQKSRPRVLVEASPQALDLAATGMNRFTLGIMSRGLNDRLFRSAALQHLTAKGYRDCSLRVGGQITPDTFEWNYECQSGTPKLVPRR